MSKLPWYENFTHAEFEQKVIKHLMEHGMPKDIAHEKFKQVFNSENVFVREPHYNDYYSRRYGVMKLLERIDVKV